MKTIIRLLFVATALLFVAPLHAASKQAAEASPGLIASLKKIEKAGILTADQVSYFRQNAVKGRSIPSTQTTVLIAAFAKHLGCAKNDIDAQLETLKNKKVVKGTDTWKRSIKGGKKAPGGFTGQLIENFAKKL